MALVFSNNAETLIAAPLLLTDLTVTLAVGDAALFQTLNVGESERAVLTDGVNFEAVEITSWAGDVATITRGVEGTVQAWATGTVISSRITAGILQAMQQKVDAVAASGGSTSPIKTNVLSIPNGVTSFDMSSFNSDLTLLPDVVLLDWERTSNILFTFPSLASLNVGEVAILLLVLADSSPVGSSKIDFAVQSGEYMGITLNGTDYAYYTSNITWSGFKAADGTLHWYR